MVCCWPVRDLLARLPITIGSSDVSSYNEWITRHIDFQDQSMHDYHFKYVAEGRKRSYQTQQMLHAFTSWACGREEHSEACRVMLVHDVSFFFFFTTLEPRAE